MRSENNHLVVGLTIEDDFILTRLRNKARNLKGDARDQYLWKTIFRFVCRERAYKSVMDEFGVAIDTNIDIFEDESNE